MHRKKHVEYKDKIHVFVIDPNYVSHYPLYQSMLQDPLFVVTALINVNQAIHHADLLKTYHVGIITPSMPTYGHYESPKRSHEESCAQVGLRYYRKHIQSKDELKNLKIIVWAKSESAALEHWGDHIVQREVIENPKDPKGFCFAETIKRHLHLS